LKNFKGWFLTLSLTFPAAAYKCRNNQITEPNMRIISEIIDFFKAFTKMSCNFRCKFQWRSRGSML